MALNGLVMKSLAPRESASRSASGERSAVMTAIGNQSSSGRAATTCEMSSIPSKPGMWMSVISRSASCSRISSGTFRGSSQETSRSYP